MDHQCHFHNIGLPLNFGMVLTKRSIQCNVLIPILKMWFGSECYLNHMRQCTELVRLSLHFAKPIRLLYTVDSHDSRNPRQNYTISLNLACTLVCRITWLADLEIGWKQGFFELKLYSMKLMKNWTKRKRAQTSLWLYCLLVICGLHIM